MRNLYKTLLVIVILVSFFGLAYREVLIRKYPITVRHYQSIMKKISSEEYITKMQEYMGFGGETDYGWARPRMHYATALQWLGERLKYPVIYTDNELLDTFRKENKSHEDPITIIEFGLGRCGEFTIAYTAICLANGWDVRMVLDTNDHMWVELWTIPPNGTEFKWMHIEVTDGAIWCKNYSNRNPIDCPMINDPLRYARAEKDMGDMWAIEADYAERVDDVYKVI